MNMEEAIKQLLDRVAHIEANMATRQDVADLRDELKAEIAGVRADVREGTRAMRHYVGYVEGLLNTVTRGQLASEDRIEALERRMAELERRNPPTTQ